MVGVLQQVLFLKFFFSLTSLLDPTISCLYCSFWGKDPFLPNNPHLVAQVAATGQKPPDRAFNHLRLLQERHKSLFARFPQEIQKISEALTGHDAWVAKARELIMRPEKVSINFDQLLRIMWRTATIAGRGMGYAPILVPDSGELIAGNGDSNVTCFCKLPDVTRLSLSLFFFKLYFID